MPQLQQQDSLNAVSLLDNLIPLRDASHTDVVEYSVEVPYRYAECYDLLQDGRKVGLAEPWNVVGLSSYSPRGKLLFRVNGAHLELDVEDELAGKAPGKIHNIVLEAMALRTANTMRKFIGTDGGRLLLASA